MFCGKCGSQIAEGRGFCGNCGAPTRSAADSSGAGGNTAVAVAPSPVTVTAPPAKPRVPLSLAKKLLAGTLAFIIAVAAGGYWWWTHRPVPAYEVEDPGIYPFQVMGADGKTQQFGFVDATGKVIVQPSWDAVGRNLVLGRVVTCSEGLCPVLKNGKWGYIDTTGHLAVPNQFDAAGPFVNGLAWVKLGSQIGYIEKTGRYVINPQFSNAGDFFAGLAAAQGDDGWGFIGKSGKWAIPPHFSGVDLDGFYSGLAAACMGGKCGYISKNGTFAIRPQFGIVNTFSDGLAPVQIAGKWGYIDRSGAVVINPQFDQATTFSGGFAVVKVSTNTGTIDSQGRFVVNPGQYMMDGAEDTLQRVGTTDGKIGLITRDGKWVISPTHALRGIGSIYGKVFEGVIGNQLTPVTTSGTVLAGWYKGATLSSLTQDLTNESDALASIRTLVNAETSYSNAFPKIGFTSSLIAMGPAANGNPDENHAGLIDAALASDTDNNYQFAVSIPQGTSTGGTNFNYLITATPSSGHVGRIFCADSTGTVRYSMQGQPCTASSPPFP